MDTKTLEALSAFVYEAKSLLCETSELGYNNTDFHAAAEALEGELEKEINVRKMIDAMASGNDEFLFNELPEMLKRQAT